MSMQKDTRTPIRYIREECPDFESPAYRGTRYRALVPDTLDLQERAALAVRGLTGPTDPDADYEIYWAVFFRHNPPMMQHDDNDHVQVKFVEALPLMRLASGSGVAPEVERRWMEVVLQMQGPDGLLYYPVAGRPWCRITPFGHIPDDALHYTRPYDDGRLLGALALYYQITGNRLWREAGEGVVQGLGRLARGVDDWACYDAIAYGLGGQSAAPAGPVDPITYSCAGWAIQGLAQFYRATGHDPSLQLAGQLSRHLKDRSGYFGPEAEYLADSSRRPNRHFHHHTMPLLAMADYAMLAGDRGLLDFARKGYEYGRAHGNAILGYFPENIGAQNLQTSEICEVADMIALAVKLSLAGAGDYWDDVDRWTRNQFAEGQLLRVDWIPRLLDAGMTDARLKLPASTFDPSHQTVDRVAERNIGAFAGWPDVNDWFVGHGRGIMHCCTGNGTRAIYYVWDNILHHDDGRLRVNLLLNRASPWADVDSHIPYQGRVDVRVKAPCDLSVRIPEWVRPEKVAVRVGEEGRQPDWAGRYAEVGPVRPGDVVTLTFPISERTEDVYVEKRRFTITRKGNDVVDVYPPGQYCPLYQRAHYRVDHTRWREIERFVAEDRVHW